MRREGKQETIQKIDKEQLIEMLTEELPSLRAKIGLTQAEISSIIGISRPTYSLIESKKRRMTWNTYLSLILLFENNEKTKKTLEFVGAVTMELKNVLNIDGRSSSN